MDVEGLGGLAPAAHSQDLAVLTAIRRSNRPGANEDTEGFRNILDIPFVTINRIGPNVVGEVILTGDPIYDLLRISRALEAAAKLGYTATGRVYGDYGVTISFSDGGM